MENLTGKILSCALNLVSSPWILVILLSVVVVAGWSVN